MYVEITHIIFVEKWFQLATNKLRDVSFKPCWNVIIYDYLQASNVVNAIGKHLILFEPQLENENLLNAFTLRPFTM